MQKPNEMMCSEWRSHPVTLYILDSINVTIKELEEVWSTGGYVSDTEFETLKLNLKALGMAQALNHMYDEIKDIAQENDDVEA